MGSGRRRNSASGPATSRRRPPCPPGFRKPAGERSSVSRASRPREGPQVAREMTAPHRWGDLASVPVRIRAAVAVSMRGRAALVQSSEFSDPVGKITQHG